MKKYFVQKLGYTEFEDTILIGEVKRMANDALLPINNCENYIVNKGQIIVCINGIIFNLKNIAQNNILIYDTYDEALENYIRLEKMKNEELKKEINKNMDKE